MVDFTKSWDEIVELNDGVPFEKSEQQAQTSQNNEQALDILSSKKFVQTLRDYYAWRDGESTLYTGASKLLEGDDADVIEYFYNDRTWRNNNTV